MLQQDYGLELPRHLQMEFSEIVQRAADESESEQSPEAIYAMFKAEYLDASDPFEMLDHRTVPEVKGAHTRRMTATIRDQGVEKEIVGHGNGPIDSFVDAFRQTYGIEVSVNRHRLCRGHRERHHAARRGHGFEHRHRLAQGHDERHQPRHRQGLRDADAGGLNNILWLSIGCLSGRNLTITSAAVLDARPREGPS